MSSTLLLSLFSLWIASSSGFTVPTSLSFGKSSPLGLGHHSCLKLDSGRNRPAPPLSRVSCSLTSDGRGGQRVRGIVKLQESSTGVPVYIVGAMHYNPVSIQRASTTVCLPDPILTPLPPYPLWRILFLSLFSLPLPLNPSYSYHYYHPTCQFSSFSLTHCPLPQFHPSSFSGDKTIKIHYTTQLCLTHQNSHKTLHPPCSTRSRSLPRQTSSPQSSLSRAKRAGAPQCHRCHTPIILLVPLVPFHPPRAESTLSIAASSLIPDPLFIDYLITQPEWMRRLLESEMGAAARLAKERGVEVVLGDQRIEDTSVSQSRV
jgi:hypothetical protein